MVKFNFVILTMTCSSDSTQSATRLSNYIPHSTRLNSTLHMVGGELVDETLLELEWIIELIKLKSVVGREIYVHIKQ